MKIDLVQLQQQGIAGGMRTMPPEIVNQILSQMNFEEASVFLGRLGALRARMIYFQYPLSDHWHCNFIPK